MKKKLDEGEARVVDRDERLVRVDVARIFQRRSPAKDDRSRAGRDLGLGAVAPGGTEAQGAGGVGVGESCHGVHRAMSRATAVHDAIAERGEDRLDRKGAFEGDPHGSSAARNASATRSWLWRSRYACMGRLSTEAANPADWLSPAGSAGWWE